MTNTDETTIRLIARDEVTEALRSHLIACPFSTTLAEQRLRHLEIRFSFLIGTMMGSGALGGLCGAALTKLLAS